MENIINEYNAIKKPEELLNFMNKYINYGYIGSESGKLHVWEDNDYQDSFENDYALTSPIQLLRNRYGQCWDQVELERDWFSKNNYKFKTLYIMFLFEHKNNFPTHSYLVFQKNNKWYWFEHSDIINTGIHEFDSYEEAIKGQLKAHIDFTKTYIDITNEDIKRIVIFEYEKPEYGISMTDFIDNIIDNGKNITEKIIRSEE